MKWNRGLDEYQPDMVVSMMGANDRVDLDKAPGTSWGARVRSLLEKSGTYRLLVSVIGKGLRSEDIPDKEDIAPRAKPSLPPEKDIKLLYYGMALKQQEKWQQARVILERLTSLDLEDKGFVQRAHGISRLL